MRTIRGVKEVPVQVFVWVIALVLLDAVLLFCLGEALQTCVCGIFDTVPFRRLVNIFTVFV